MHSKNLEDTELWKAYKSKINSEDRRCLWVKEIYGAAANYLLDVRKTFPNYTLHDETHILNVLEAMGGLLGDQISLLTVGEMELLILAASLHDLGMVYTEEEKKKYYQEEEACSKFLRTYRPELLGCSVEEWKAEDQQWYLRTLHPFRLWDVLENEQWSELFKNAPLEIVPKACILAVCQAHGEKPEELHNNASNQSRQFLCCSDEVFRRGITLDHPFAAWLLYNAVPLNQYFPRQFQMIVGCLCNDSEEDVIEKCNSIRRQLTALPEHHGVDVSAFPELSSRDFWSAEE